MPQVTGQRQYNADLGVTAYYDTNVSRSSRAVAQLRGIAQEEFVVRPELGLSLVQPLGRQAVFLQGSVGYDFHGRNDQLNRGRADLTGGYAGQFGFCQTSLFGGYKAQQSDLTDTDGLEVKNLQESTRVGAGLTCARPIGPGAALMVQRTEAQNSAVTRRTSDATIETASLLVSYSNPTLGQLGLVYNYTSSEYPNRIIPGRPVGDGFFVTALGASVQHDFGQRISVNAIVGRSTVKREFAPAGLPLKFSSTTYGGALSYRFGSRITLDLTANRAVTPSQRQGKLYDIATAYALGARYRLGSQFVITGGYAVSEIDSNADTSTPLPGGPLRPVVTHSNTKSTFAAIQYRRGRLATISFDVRQEDRTTDVPTLNYISTRLGLTAKLSF